jgi:hypothetical protein
MMLMAWASRADAAAITYAKYFDPASGAGEQITTNAATTIDFAGLDIVSDFGVNRLSVTTKETSGTSAWLDRWLITDSALSGTAGQLSIQWTLAGTLSVTDTLACPGCDSASIVYSSLVGAPSVFSPGTVLVSASQTGTGTTTVQETGTLSVSFIYGTAFNVGFSLAGGIGDDLQSGSVNFFNSALVAGVVLPDGATLVTDNTRIQYPVSNLPPPSPIPEPSTLLLVATWVAAVLRRRSR